MFPQGERAARVSGLHAEPIGMVGSEAGLHPQSEQRGTLAEDQKA